MAYEMRFLLALMQTLVIETLLLLLFSKMVFKNRFSTKPVYFIIITGVIASSLTLPYVWFILPFLIRDRVRYIIISEVFAITAESLIFLFLFKVSYKFCFLLSFICNLFSFLSVFVVRFFTGL